MLLGNQKRLLGLDAVNSSLSNVFLERPLAVEAFNFGSRQAGIASYGATQNEAHTWQLGIFHLEDLRRSARYVGNSLQLSGNARLTGSPWYDEASDGRGYFHWGVAGMLARPDGDADFRTTNVVSQGPATPGRDRCSRYCPQTNREWDRRRSTTLPAVRRDLTA